MGLWSARMDKQEDYSCRRALILFSIFKPKNVNGNRKSDAIYSASKSFFNRITYQKVCCTDLKIFFRPSPYAIFPISIPIFRLNFHLLSRSLERLRSQVINENRNEADVPQWTDFFLVYFLYSFLELASYD